MSKIRLSRKLKKRIKKQKDQFIVYGWDGVYTFDKCNWNIVHEYRR